MNGVFTWLGGLAAAIVPGMGQAPAPAFTGYVEANYVYVAPPTGGIIATMPAREGQTVTKGEVLFTLDSAQQQALLDAAEAQQRSAEATWQNLTTGGRAEELAAAQAAVNKAEADLGLAQTTFQRAQKLSASNTITKAQLDQDSAAVASAQAGLKQAEAQLALTSLPAREEQQKAAKANVAAAAASVEKAKADLADRTIAAPADGRIERTYFDPGEMAAAGTPVLSLLPAGALKVEFYVAEPERSRLAMGQTVAIACDGCAPGITAQVSYLASDPQYTAPVIYSREERSRLVFLAEARLEGASGVLPGQPVTVSLSP
jgi:HlyD family secretion protein